MYLHFDFESQFRCIAEWMKWIYIIGVQKLELYEISSNTYETVKIYIQLRNLTPTILCILFEVVGPS